MVSETTQKAAFWMGVRHGLPFIFLLFPFGTLFGVVGSEAGLNLFEVMSFSIVVIAGAAQFTAVAMMQDEVPTLIVLVTSLAVNLRMAMYSAALTPHLGQAPLWKRGFIAYFMVDQAFALSSVTFEERADWGLPQKLGYYFGVILPVAPVWYLATLFGALVGDAMPEALALDFALPIVFLALIAPALRTAAHKAAAATSIILALVFAFLPFSLGLLIAALAAMMVGARVESWLEARR
ncbi:MAG: AzlC family ABC transporter permease [Pseudomonadota bacterium]